MKSSSMIRDFSTLFNTLSPPLAVAVSGGGDSLALLLLTHKWILERGGRLVALTVDHGLRPESTTEALQVQEWASQKGIEHVILRWEGEKNFPVSQEKARKARYNLLLSWCKTNSIPTLLLGNHQDDQIETFWLRLSAGSGLDGLGGMRERMVREGITLLRPLLPFRKEELKEILKAENHPWIEDPSNASPRFFRGRFRTFLEEEGLSTPRLTKTIEKLQEDADYIWLNLLEVVKKTLEVHEGGYITLHKTIFEDLHPALAKRVISLSIQWFSGSPYPPRSHHIQGVMDKLKTKIPFTAGGIYWFHKQGKIYLSRELSRIEEPLPLKKAEGTSLWDNRFVIDAEIKKCLPPEAVLTSLASVVRPSLVTKIDVPRRIWPTLPTITVKEKIVAIPHLCYTDSYLKEDLKKFIISKPLFHSLLRFTI